MTPLSNKKRNPKSFKADGTPKRRWTAAERAARGHKPRTRGGVRNGHTDSHGRNFEAWTPREDSRRGEDGAGKDRRYSQDRRGRGEWSDRRDDRRHDRRDGDRRRGDRWDRRDERRNDHRWSDDGEFRPRKSRRPNNRANRDWRHDDRRGSGWDRDDWRDDRRGQRRNDWRDDRRDDRRDHGNRDDRGYRGDRDRRDFQKNRDFREDRRRDDRSDWHADHDDADNMNWKATELTDLDVSGIDHEGGFSALGVPDEIVAALAATGITEPFRIQIAAIPDAIAGRDVLGRASTGSGKTLAFGVPLLSRLSTEPREDKRPRALILSPTRELAMQIADVLSPLASSMGLSTILIAGGMSYGPQTKAFKKGVDLVVATPGRLVDLLETGDADLSGVTVTVLDEADHMAELGFMEAVGSILDAVPSEGQRLLFSATLDGAVNKLVKRYMHDPVTHEIDPDKGSVSTMTHHAFQIKPHEKVGLMCEITNRGGHTIVFARTQRGASRMAEQMREAGVMAGALHGGLTQGARARVLAAFKDGSLPVLVATDVAARGIDVDDVTLVLQVDPPMNSKDYLHRSGRTARAGHDGAVVSLILPHQRRSMSRLYRQAGVKPVEAQVMMGDDHVAEVAGCSPALGAPIDEKDYEALVAPKQQRGKKSRDGKPGRGKGGRNRGGRGYDRDRRGGHGHDRGHDSRGHNSRGHDGRRRDIETRYGRSGNDTW
ncbi:hypothetical protein HMPREF1485_00449 [Propionibacterium sp. HGH0353]|nr:hypothetical protein HMPREF1485_00449 [Propionibacterium sp. HGH0353]ERS38090.1 hypothetical protein HMPREF1271_01126 [Propionibacterium sp. KPL1838]ERS69059.1 hypothetical protein HMPREF1279_00155 [Propionibacterium sp. KPL1852]